MDVKRKRVTGFGPAPKTAKAVIRQARKLLEEEGRWVTSSWFDGDGEFDPKAPLCSSWGVCADGALLAVTVGIPYGDDRHGTCRVLDDSTAPKHAAYTEARKILDRVAKVRYDSDSIISVNDFRGRDDVIEAFELAEQSCDKIRRAERKARNAVLAELVNA